jgi:hypothetical protein
MSTNRSVGRITATQEKIRSTATHNTSRSSGWLHKRVASGHGFSRAERCPKFLKIPLDSSYFL